MALVDEDWSVVQLPVRYVSAWCSHADIEPEPSDGLDAAIEWVFSQLTPEEQFIAAARYFEKVTIRELAERMGLQKSHMHRLCLRTEVRLRTVCIEHPVIRDRLVP